MPIMSPYVVFFIALTAMIFRKKKLLQPCARLTKEEKHAISKYNSYPKQFTNAGGDEIKAYVISLISRSDRRTHIRENLKGVLSNYELFDAIVPSEEQMKGQVLPKGKLGCSLSHRAIWTKILKSGVPALILEDDIFVEEKEFHDIIKTALANADKWDAVFIGHCFEEVGEKAFGGFHKSVRPRCRHGYIVSPRGASVLLTKTNLCSFGDEQLGALILNGGLRSLSFHPSPIKQSWQIDGIASLRSDLHDAKVGFK